MTVEEKRRELFEAAVRRDWLEFNVCLQRKSNGYADRETDSSWWAFNAALDAIEIELPLSEVEGCHGKEEVYFPEDVASAIESLNLGIKIK